MFNIFEQPWTLVSIGGFALFCLWLFRVFAPDKWRWWLLSIPVLIALLGFGVDWLVASDSEKIDSLIRTMTDSIQNEQPDEFEKLVSEDYKDSIHASKNSFMYYIHSRLAKPVVESAYQAIITKELSGRTAEIVMTIRFVFDKESDMYQTFTRLILAKIKMDLAKDSLNRWLIERIEVKEVNKQPSRWKDVHSTKW